MKIKLTKQQLESFFIMVDTELAEGSPTGVADQLIWTLMDKLKERLRSKVRKLPNGIKASLTINIKDEEACAFYLWYQNIIVPFPANVWKYERLTGDKIWMEVDREFG